MELLPVLAEIFDISVDKLLGVDNIIEKKKVNKYLERFQDAISVGKIDETLPSRELCRENQIWWGLENNEKLDFLHKKIFELDDLICDGQAKYKNWGVVGSNYEFAKLYARLGDTENAYKHLTEAAKAAKSFVNRPATQSFN